MRILENIVSFLSSLRFMSGMGHVGTFMMSFNLALECVGPKYRTVFGILIETPFAIGGLIVGLVSWAGVRDWKLLTLGKDQICSLLSTVSLSVLSAPNLLLLVLWWLLPESPRWLIAKNKKAQLSSVLEQASRVNKKDKKFDQIINSGVKEDTSSSTDSIASATLVDLFWPPTILIR